MRAKMQRLGVILLSIATIWANPSWKEKASFVPFKDLDHRIINGDKATRSQFPWQVAIYVSQFGSTTLCGGALISDTWILTAGHCVQSSTNFRIALGSTLLTGADSDRIVLETSEYVQHEDYSQSTLANDIALIPLPQAVTFTDTIRPITLSGGALDPNKIVTVSGWGLTSDSSTSASNDLMYTDLVTISNSDCGEAYGSSINSGVICGQSSDSIVHSTCEGDSGGPLVFDIDSSKPLHVGVVSFGHSEGCESGKPAGFTRTYYYRDWIREKTGI